MSVSPVSLDNIYFLYGKENQNLNNKTHICFGYTDDKKKNGIDCYVYEEWGSREQRLVDSMLKPMASTMEECNLGDLTVLDVYRKIILYKNESYKVNQESLTERISRFAQALIVCSKHGFVQLKNIDRYQLMGTVGILVQCVGFPILFDAIANNFKPRIRPGATLIEVAEASQNFKELLKPFKRFVVRYCLVGAIGAPIFLTGFLRNFQDRYLSYYNEFGPPQRFYKLLKLRKFVEVA